jgi:MEKHLA domain
LLPVSSPFDLTFFSLLSGSYERLLGRSLTSGAPAGADAADWLYHEAPFGVLAQDASDDPAFVYANTAAQLCFEYSWDAFRGLPSRLSAPPADREAREKLLAGVLRDGYFEGYRGLRESATGRRFWIEDVTIWNLAAADGAVRGQAALIRSWSDV